MEPLSFSALALVASLCMPPRSVDLYPRVWKLKETVLGYPIAAGSGFIAGPPVVGVELEYQFGLGKVRTAILNGSKFDVEMKINQILAPHSCATVNSLG